MRRKASCAKTAFAGRSALCIFCGERLSSWLHQVLLRVSLADLHTLIEALVDAFCGSYVWTVGYPETIRAANLND
jgi:hypothetical protein